MGAEFVLPLAAGGVVPVAGAKSHERPVLLRLDGGIAKGVSIVREWRLALVILAGLAAAVAATAVSVAVNMLSGSTAGWLKAMERHPLRWSIAATVAAAVASLLAWWAQRRYDQGLAELVPAVQQPEPWVVDRPAEVGQIVRALKRKAGGTVGITTAVQGVGGFGKTTVAKMVRADRRVLRRYRGRVHWVTLGRDAGKEALPGLVNGLIAQLDPNRAVTFTDARLGSPITWPRSWLRGRGGC